MNAKRPGDALLSQSVPLEVVQGDAVAGSHDAYERLLDDAMAGDQRLFARQDGVDELHILVDDDGGVLARRAAAFSEPPVVWRVCGRGVEPALPTPLPSVPSPPPGAEALAELIRGAGAEVVVEHGVLVGEVLGLEVVRVVGEGDELRLEVGVGRNDREAFAAVHGDVPTDEALADAVAAVRRHRYQGAPPHPLWRLAAERWLRHRIVAEPGLVGAEDLEPVAPAVPRESLTLAVPATALGRDNRGGQLMAVCSTGIDLDLVPAAADARLAHAPSARLLVVVPRRDDYPAMRALAGALTSPAEVTVVSDDWRG